MIELSPEYARGNLIFLTVVFVLFTPIMARDFARSDEMSAREAFIGTLAYLLAPILGMCALMLYAGYFIHYPAFTGSATTGCVLLAVAVRARRIQRSPVQFILTAVMHVWERDTYRFKPHVRVTSYGNRRAPSAHAVIVAPHFCMRRHMWGVHPELPSRVWKCDPRIREEYLAIEEDVGSHLLAHETARAIVRCMPGVRVDVAAYRMARGIVDGNRVTEKAVQEVFDHAAYPELVAAFRELHRTTIAKIWKVLDALHPNGLVLDCHSMAPYDPQDKLVSKVQAAEKSPTTLDRYNHAFMHPEGQRRRLDVLTVSEDEYIADRRLAELFGEELTRGKVQWAENDPYALAEETMSAAYLRRFRGRGIAFDVPKDYLTEQEGQDAARNLPYLTVSKRKVKALAGTIAEAISRRLQDERECVPSLGSR